MKELPTQEQINAKIYQYKSEIIQAKRDKLEKIIKKFTIKNHKPMERIGKELAEIGPEFEFYFDKMSVKIKIKLY